MRLGYFFKKNPKKSQVSMEYLAIFSFAFLLTMPLLIIYVTQTGNLNADITGVQAYNALSKIVESAEEVYGFGEPAQKTINVDFPKGIENVIITDNSITFNITTTDSNYPMPKDTFANITGSIRSYEGPHRIVIKAIGSQVNISDA
jgi:uncharacterized protein (UPF0333 family)